MEENYLSWITIEGSIVIIDVEKRKRYFEGHNS